MNWKKRELFRQNLFDNVAKEICKQWDLTLNIEIKTNKIPLTFDSTGHNSLHWIHSDSAKLN